MSSESKTFVGILCEIDEINVQGSRSVQIALVQSVVVFGVHLSGEFGKLVLVTHVFENDQVFCI